MAINFRGRVEGLDAKDMGNYESALMVGPQVYERPTALRAAMTNGPPYKMHKAPLPGLFELFTVTPQLVRFRTGRDSLECLSWRG